MLTAWVRTSAMPRSVPGIAWSFVCVVIAVSVANFAGECLCEWGQRHHASGRFSVCLARCAWLTDPRPWLQVRLRQPMAGRCSSTTPSPHPMALLGTLSRPCALRPADGRLQHSWVGDDHAACGTARAFTRVVGLTDWTGDGVVDLVVARDGFSSPPGVRWYKNAGTNAAPVYELDANASSW